MFGPPETRPLYAGAKESETCVEMMRLVGCRAGGGRVNGVLSVGAVQRLMSGV